ncbi:hypothetical protein BGZ99_001405, partial [Dissophora globulifera]
MDSPKQRHIRSLDGTHGFHSPTERDPQSAQEISAHSPFITPDSVHRRTSSNNAVDGSLEGTAVNSSSGRYDRTALAYDEGSLFEKDDSASDRNRILDLDNSTDCYQRTDFAPRQVLFTPAPALPYNSAVRSPVTISSRRYSQGQGQKQASEWHHIDQMTVGRFINIEPAALQQQQTAIRHPVLSSPPVPSRTAPTVFPLVSSISNPIVSKISMNLPRQPIAEQVPVPFETFLRPPPNTGIGLPPRETSSGVTSSIQSQHDASQQLPFLKQSFNLESISRATQAAPNSSPDRTRVGGKDDEIHSIFESAGLAERPISSHGNQTPHEATGCNLSMVLPPRPTTLLTPSTNTNKTPVHDKDLDPFYFKTKADHQQKAEDNQVDNNNTIGSRTTAIEFAPMKNNDDHKASIQSREERLLRDGHIRLTLPLDERKIEKAAAVEASAPPPTAEGFDIKAISSGNSRMSDRIGVELSSHPSTVDGNLSESDVNMEALRVKEEISISKFDYIEKVNEAPTRDKEKSIESLVESMDWSKTGLGPRSGWPRELAMTFQVILKSTSPLGIYWGDKDYMLYNDAWRPIQKQKHPQSMGAPGAVVWSEICDGYDEECYFDFSFSPIFLEDNSIGGILALVNDITPSVINQRRLETINQFSKQAPLIQSIESAYSMTTTILQESNNLDVPFSIVYKTKEVDNHSNTSHPQGVYTPSPSIVPTVSTPATNAQLYTPPGYEDPIAAWSFAGKEDARRVPQSAILSSTSFDSSLEEENHRDIKERIFSKATSNRHIPDYLPITPDEYEPFNISGPVYDDPWTWPVRSVLADGIPRLVKLPKSTHKLARALVLPILENPSVRESRITAVLIVGINPCRMLDNHYLEFLSLIAANIASLRHFGRSREEERRSTEALLELNKAKISFFQNVSHELRTPLTLMMAPLDDVLNQAPEDTVTRPKLEMVRRNSRRLLKLVNTLLQFSRVETGKSNAIFEETDLSKVTREISANFESVASGFGLKYIII